MHASPTLTRRALLGTVAGTAALLGLGTVGYVAARPSGRQLLAPVDTAYALGAAGPDVLRITPQGSVIARATLPDPATGLTPVPASGRVVAAVTGKDRLWSLAGDDLGGVRELSLHHPPEIVAARPGRDQIAFAGIGAGAVTLVDAATLAVLARATGLAAPHDLRFDADGARLHVSLLDMPEIVTLEADTLRPVSSLRLPFPRGIDHMSATVDGRWGIAASPGHAGVAIVSLEGTVGAIEILALETPIARAYTGPRGDLVWLPSTSEPAIFRIDLTGNRTIERIAVRALVNAMVFEPFATTMLALHEDGITRIDRAGRVTGTCSARAASGAVIESAVGTMLLGTDGHVAFQRSHRPLDPLPLPAPQAFSIASATSLSYCH